MKTRVNVFFYGLFMDADLLRSKGLHPSNVRTASVDGLRLHIGQRATLISEPNGLVYGVVMELTHDEIDQLYAEPSVSSYRPEPVVVSLGDGSQTPALSFILPNSSDRGSPNPEYAAKLRELGRRIGLPSTYVEKIIV